MIHPAKLVRAAVLTVALAGVCAVSASAADLGIGTVTGDGLRLRSEAGTEASVLATASAGENVVVIEDAGGGWYKVDYDSIEGYMSGEFLTVVEKADMELGYGLVQTDGATLNVRTGPNMESDKVATLYNNTVVSINGFDNGWFKITTTSGTTGYVLSDYLVTCRDSSGARGDGSGVSTASGFGQQVVDYAKQYMGCPYVYGSSGPNSFDCSGFTSYVYRHFGYSLIRTASGQLGNGYSVSKSELQPGDLVFFRYNTSKAASHVGIYIGGGQFIHASTNTYTVRTDSLTSGHYANVYVGARRIV